MEKEMENVCMKFLCDQIIIITVLQIFRHRRAEHWWQAET